MMFDKQQTNLLNLLKVSLKLWL